jgi:hypothetical protein
MSYTVNTETDKVTFSGHDSDQYNVVYYSELTQVGVKRNRTLDDLTLKDSGNYKTYYENGGFIRIFDTEKSLGATMLANFINGFDIDFYGSISEPVFYGFVVDNPESKTIIGYLITFDEKLSDAYAVYKKESSTPYKFGSESTRDFDWFKQRWYTLYKNLVEITKSTQNFYLNLNSDDLVIKNDNFYICNLEGVFPIANPIKNSIANSYYKDIIVTHLNNVVFNDETYTIALDL